MAEKDLPNFTADALEMSSIESKFLPPNEMLVGFGFRCWLRGYQNGNAESWQCCWDYFCHRLGAGAHSAVSDLSEWVNAIRCCKLREIDLLPPDCRSFCRDECLAVTLVAASEHRDCPALQICAHLLLGAENIAPAMSSAHRFSKTLQGYGITFDGPNTEADPPRRLN